MNNDLKSLIACPECDLLQKRVELPRGGEACCSCCGAVLYQRRSDSINRTCALIVASAVFFLVANVYPIMGIIISGNRNEVNLLGAVHALWDQDMHIISSLVFVTTILLPALELGLMLCLLLPLCTGRIPSGLPWIMRILQWIKPWGMVEVLMLGLVVALVKLTSSAGIIIDTALWSFAALTLLMAAAASTFDTADVWSHLDPQEDVDEY